MMNDDTILLPNSFLFKFGITRGHEQGDDG